MRDTDSPPDRHQDSGGETYGTVTLNDRGRLTIPKSLREDLTLTPGTEFTVIRDGATIRLVRKLPPLETLTRETAWETDAFPNAGRSTFGDLEDA